jgi:hypothetical protein
MPENHTPSKRSCRKPVAHAGAIIKKAPPRKREWEERGAEKRYPAFTTGFPSGDKSHPSDALQSGWRDCLLHVLVFSLSANLRQVSTSVSGLSDMV